MDPNAALAAIRAALFALNTGPPVIGDDIWEEDMHYALGDDLKEAIESLAEHVHALDEWLSHGGSLPQDWLRGTGRAGR